MGKKLAYRGADGDGLYAEGALRIRMRRGSQMHRVLVISYDFPPSTEVGGHACAQIARNLPLYGWEPDVLTVQER